MAEKRRKYDAEFREGAVRIVRETGKPVAQVARDLGVHEGTLGNWVNKDRVERGEKEGLTVDERRRLEQLERGDAGQLRVGAGVGGPRGRGLAGVEEDGRRVDGTPGPCGPLAEA